ncbi:MAG: leucine-rich repeat domain-containing protein [Lachnospiraceae bacterium]|nr:leucine-rich repeat domain-containing protein [Lachnospiraceae bacterium]
MGLVAAKCTQCGANIEVDDTKEAGICKYCGTAFIIEKAITNYNTYITNNTNINANVVNVYNTQKNFVIKAGKLIEYNGKSKNVIIPSDVNIIGGKAFSKANWENDIDGSNINKIFIPASVVEIEEDAFYNCKDLAVVVMTNETAKIGCSCFYGCTKLTTINIVNSNNNIFNFDDVQEGIVQLPKNLQKVSSLLFHKCESITKVIIPDGVTSIDSFAFTKAIRLNEITIPDSVADVGGVSGGAFHESPFDKDNIHIVHASESWKQKHYTAISCLESYAPVKENQNNGCYIATCIYGSYDCPQVWTLRRFRDYTLDETWYGRLFIKCYYAISPTLVKWFGKRKWFRNFWKCRLDKMVSDLNNKGVNNTFYND